MEQGPVKSCLSLPTHLKEKIRVCVTVWEERERQMERESKREHLKNKCRLLMSMQIASVYYSISKLYL